jgi:hypothetical protein
LDTHRRGGPPRTERLNLCRPRCLRAQYGLGEYADGRRLPRLSVRTALGWIALVCLAFFGTERLASAHRQRVLAARHVGPLTQLLDSGQPVTIGSLTVDRLGISSQATAENGGRWHVSFG